MLWLTFNIDVALAESSVCCCLRDITKARLTNAPLCAMFPLSTTLHYILIVH